MKTFTGVVFCLALLQLSVASYGQDMEDRTGLKSFEVPGIARKWLGASQERRAYLARGMMQGLSAAMLALDVVWTHDPRVAELQGAYQEGAGQFRQAMKDLGGYTGKEVVMAPEEIVARLDAFYLRPGNENEPLWGALLLILVERNVPTIGLSAP